MRQAFGRGFWVGGALAGLDDRDAGPAPAGHVRAPSRDAEQELLRTDRAQSYPAPDGKLTFDKLSSVFASGNKTRDDQPNHIRDPARRCRATLAEMWVRMCPAQVYELGGREATARRRSRSRRRTASSAARSPPRAAA